ncbi:adenylate kinase [Candidatus Pantoea edessiphila]|uniref:Adenylate kinase n=1 Tax=Candidatus Pantoea edessiphila TaxID=2044610 RepID=A0A2P5SXE0_9GAMM|nr:adenylate kinase [Candidatus Pantoea edessiphila]MBK4775810.1 adenylate kinase [Pantoea sp. Edef]PPI87008.1 adenylate kinase [Candidatus Pantoea edessiphila]
MRLILLGAPGTGKGTQSQFIAKKYGIPQISTGDMLRKLVNEDTKIGKSTKIVMDTGQLITDDIVINLVKNRINYRDCKNGFLLDGFPRTIIQAESMKKVGIKIDKILELIVPDDLIIKRITGRRVHIPSGRVYHVLFNPPKSDNKDDITGEELNIRSDDREEIIINRLDEYYKTTAALIKYYIKESQLGNIRYFKIDGTKKVYEVSSQLIEIIEDK